MSEWLSIVEYARQLNMSDMTVRRRIKTGKIHAVLRDGKYYIPSSEAERRLHSQGSRPAHLPSNMQANAGFDPFMGAQQKSFTTQRQTPPAAPVVRPQHVSTPSAVATFGNVDPQALLSFCETAIKKLNDSEQRLEVQYRETIARLQAEIANRDLQIGALSQQVEDLQLLTKILEKKK